jgi:hypothetical protein
VQQIPPVLLGFLGDNLFLAFPPQLAPRLDLIGKILVGFEPLQTAAHLTGELLRVNLWEAVGAVARMVA